MRIYFPPFLFYATDSHGVCGISIHTMRNFFSSNTIKNWFLRLHFTIFTT